MQQIIRQKLAIHGGEKIRSKPFPAYRTIGDAEKQAVLRVLDSGVLSRFVGAWHADFNGGNEVCAFEAEWAAHFGVKHAITVNSATSGLFAAAGAAGLEPGDEVIVSPYTMSASAVAPLIYQAIPVFADIEADYYCLSAQSIEARITPRTRVIIVVDIFGLPYDADAINALAKKHNLIVIEDCAQAPGAVYRGRFAGTLADMGVYSLNYHKHIHTGEGGVIVTNNDELAERLRLIRNHAEAVLPGMKPDLAMWDSRTLNNMVGFNYRMTELEAAIGREQLKKLPDLLAERLDNVRYLNRRLAEIPCIEPTAIRPECTHAFYVHPLKFKADRAGVHRNFFIDAVKAELSPSTLREGEGVRISSGYVKPLYLQPMYQKRIAFGTQGAPWRYHSGHVDYSEGICPTAEKMYAEELFFHELMRPPMSRDDLDDVVRAFEKVWDLRTELL